MESMGKYTKLMRQQETQWRRQVFISCRGRPCRRLWGGCVRRVGAKPPARDARRSGMGAGTTLKEEAMKAGGVRTGVDGSLSGDGLNLTSVEMVPAGRRGGETGTWALPVGSAGRSNI